MLTIAVGHNFQIPSRGLLVVGRLVEGETTRLLPRKGTVTVIAEGNPPQVFDDAQQVWVFDANWKPDDVLLLLRHATKADVPIGAQIVFRYS